MQQFIGAIFPGQGSQKEGMLAELASQHPIIRQTFAEASEILSYDLWALSQNDPDQQLDRTSITQPAILTASVAIWRLWLEQQGPLPVLMAGHSLGEYSALVCAGVISFTDAVRLVQKRGELMQSAVPLGVGSMAAIVGLDDKLVIEACEEVSGREVVSAVNFNSPGQVVIAGHSGAVRLAGERCREKGAKRALALPVSAPFHSPLMQGAAEKFAEELSGVELKEAVIPVLQNYQLSMTGQDLELIRNNLVKQIYNPVPWVETIRHFAGAGITIALELGPGKVLCGLNRRIEPEMTVFGVNDQASLTEALQQCRKQE